MAKKLKKKIEDMCCLASLGWEARQYRATQILSSTEWKQQLCNSLIGLSFRDLERILSGIATERQKREDNEKLKTTHRKRNGSRQRPSHKDSIGSIAKTAPKRTLPEILAQVNSPRILDERRSLFEGVFSDSNLGDDTSDE